MRFVDDGELSFCLTISKDIKLDTMLDILGRQEALPELHTFDDFSWDTHQPGRNGLLNVFEHDGFVITVENNGFLGVTRRTIKSIAVLDDISHYAAIYHSAGGSNGYMYCEVQDGTIVANFDPLTDEPPEALIGSSPGPGISAADWPRQPRRSMIKAIEYRMETTVLPEWLETPTTTYLIDYRTPRGD